MPHDMAQGTMQIIDSVVSIPTTHSNITLVSGGYYRIGKLIIVNMRLVCDQLIAAHGYPVTNLPIPDNSITTSGSSVVPVYNNINGNIFLLNDGKIYATTELQANQMLLLSCVYICK